MVGPASPSTVLDTWVAADLSSAGLAPQLSWHSPGQGVRHVIVDSWIARTGRRRTRT